MPAAAPSLSDRLLALALWVETHGVTLADILDAGVNHWGDLRVHLDPGPFRRVVGDGPIEHHDDASHVHLHATVDGVQLVAIEPVEELPLEPDMTCSTCCRAGVPR